MELSEAIRGRRSIRRYEDRPVPREIISEILELARLAPSSMNGQPWHFVVVTSSEAKAELARIKDKYCPVEKLKFTADHVSTAAAVIITCVDKGLSYDRAIENGVLATANIMLAAHSLGLGTVYMSAYKATEAALSGEISEFLKIPPELVPITLIPLGYPAESPEDKALKPLEDMISHETYGGK